MKALRTPCQPPASSTQTESCCRCALSCMMCGAPSSSRHTAPRWCAWRYHWMASCLPQPQSGARLCVYTPQQTPPSCRCVAMQAQEPMALFRCSCWADVGKYITRQGQVSCHHWARAWVGNGLLCWVLPGGLLPVISLAQQTPPSNRCVSSAVHILPCGCWLCTDAFAEPQALGWGIHGRRLQALLPGCQLAIPSSCSSEQHGQHDCLPDSSRPAQAPVASVQHSLPSTALQELRRGADPARIFSIAFSRGESPDFVAVTSDKHTVHVFNLDRKQTQAIPALDQGDGQANGEQSPKNPISALSFVSVSSLGVCMACGKGQRRNALA